MTANSRACRSLMWAKDEKAMPFWPSSFGFMVDILDGWSRWVGKGDALDSRVKASVGEKKGF